MYILTLETTGPKASVAIIDQDGNIADINGDELLNHLKSVMPMTQELIQKLGLSMKDITAVAASKGPGSFTGIRIGVSAARALGQALSVPCIGVPTLETFRYNLAVNDQKRNESIICPIFDARRNQVYGSAYIWEETVVPGGAYTLTELLEKIGEAVNTSEILPKNILFFGDGIDKYENKILEWAEGTGLGVRFAPVEIRYQRASSAARLALQYYLAGLTENYNDLKPDYMRLAEAERKLREQKLNG